jgi:ATP-dependent DNA ligase
VFDILYIKNFGDSEEINLMGARLSDRKIVLSRVLKEIPNTLEVVMGKECEGVDAVFEEFNQSIFNNEEGIIIKKPDSTYKPNERS